MSVNPTEAQQSIETIERIQRDIRRTLACGNAPYYLMLWGVVYLFGFMANQYAPPATAEKIWMTAAGLGVVISFLIGWRSAQRVRMPGMDARVGLFWLASFFYIFLLIWLSGVSDGTAISLMITVFIMFIYLIMGLWLWRPLAWIGLFVTAVAVAAYLLIPDYVNLIMAWVGGGALFFSGLHMLRHWR